MISVQPKLMAAFEMIHFLHQGDITGTQVERVAGACLSAGREGNRGPGQDPREDALVQVIVRERRLARSPWGSWPS